jgi:hypothetical protein
MSHLGSTWATDQSAISNRQLEFLFLLVYIDVFSVNDIIFAAACRGRRAGGRCLIASCFGACFRRSGLLVKCLS